MNLASQNLIAFKNAARNLQEVGIPFDKSYIKNNTIIDELRSRADAFVNGIVDILDEEDGLKKYISGSKNLKIEYRKYLVDNFVYNIDFEHMLVAYKKIMIESKDLNEKNRANALLYYLAAKQFKEDLDEIGKTVIKNKIKPIFELNNQNFRWKRCNKILRKFMLSLSKPEGYNCYYYEKNLLGHIALMVGLGKHDVASAEAILKKKKKGLLMTHLDLVLEEKLINLLTSGRISFSDNENDRLYDGEYSNAYISAEINLDSEFNSKGDKEMIKVINVNNVIMSPIMIELTGMVMKAMLDEIYSHGVNKSDCYIYYLSPYCFGLALKNHIDLEDVAPKYYSSLKLVSPLNERSLVYGEYL